MALRDSTGDFVDLAQLGYVARFRLGADLSGERLEPLPPACEQDAVPAALGQEPGRGGADPARASGYDCEANSSSVLRLISTVSVIGSA
jgi:hypothetical protein